MRWALSAALLLASTLAPRGALAYCQSLSVTQPATTRCDEPCLTIEDFTPEEIRSRRIVPLEWSQGCFTWTLHPRGTTDLPRVAVLGAVERAFDEWLSTDCGAGPVGFVRAERAVPELSCEYIDHVIGEPNVNVIVFAEDWSARFNPPNAFALTNTWFRPSTGEIVGVDMEINDERRTWAICPPEGCDDGRVDLENVLVHEAGHWFGLAHSPDSDQATMWACSDAGETLKRDLALDDENGWCALYGSGIFTECEAQGEPPLLCRFVGDACDPSRPAATCESGYCEDLGDGFVCTIPCEEDPTACPAGTECLLSGEDRAARCTPAGCGCRIGGQGGSGWRLAGLLLAAALLAWRRRVTR